MKARLALVAAAALTAAGAPALAGVALTVPSFADRGTWSMEVGGSGTVFFDCLVPAACGTRSIVSVHFFTDVGPQGPIADQAAEFRTRILATENVVDMKVTALRSGDLADGIFAQDYDYQITYIPGAGDPSAAFWTSGEYYEAAERYLVSISSSAPTAAFALANYRSMVDFLLDPAHPPVPGELSRRTK